MSAQYIFRMDDITPTMDWGRFCALIRLFIGHNIKPLLGVVPDNRDPSLNRDESRSDFWEYLRTLQQDDKVDIAQHGYQHTLTYRPGAALLGLKYGIKEFSEFAGDNLELQMQKIGAGRNLLLEKGINSRYWMAPNHSFDSNTLIALRSLNFTAISDGVSLYPFELNGIVFVPQQTWQPKWMPCGVQTICIHSNHITPSDVKKLRTFLRRPFNFSSFSVVVDQHRRLAMHAIADATFKTAYLGARYLKRRNFAQSQIEEPNSEKIGPLGQVPPQPLHQGN